MATTLPRVPGDRVDAKPRNVAPASSPRRVRAREGLADAPPSQAARARDEARILLALFSVSLLWCSSLSASEALVDLVLPPDGRPTDTATVIDAASLLAAHARRAERDNAACAERQMRACVENVRLDADAESRRADDVAERNEQIASLAVAVSDACVALNARVENALTAIAAARAPEDLLWRDEGDANRSSCSARDRAKLRARASVAASASKTTRGDSTDDPMRLQSLTNAVSDASTTYRLAAETYRVETELALGNATGLLSQRAAYDKEYATNTTKKLRLERFSLTQNVTAELIDLLNLSIL
jgi:hypothetical protein